MLKIDVTNLPHLEARRKALETQAAADQIAAEREADAALKALREKRAAEFDRLSAATMAALDPIDREIKAACERYDARFDALEDEAVEFKRNWECDCRLVCCALSGLPILDEEEVIEDEHTGDVIIRALLPFPRDEADEG